MNLFGFLSASQDQWVLAVVVAACIYGALLTYLTITHHMTFAKEGNHNSAGCVDHREHVHYRIPGGVGSYSLGLTPWLAYQYLGWDWLPQLARIQFAMAVVDILLLYVQFLLNSGKETVILRSHGLREPGCGRTSVWDPIGLTLYIIQIFTKQEWLGYIRGIWQFFLYDLVGFIPAFIVNLPSLIFGKFVIPIPL